MPPPIVIWSSSAVSQVTVATSLVLHRLLVRHCSTSLAIAHVCLSPNTPRCLILIVIVSTTLSLVAAYLVRSAIGPALLIGFHAVIMVGYHWSSSLGLTFTSINAGPFLPAWLAAHTGLSLIHWLVVSFTSTFTIGRPSPSINCQLSGIVCHQLTPGHAVQCLNTPASPLGCRVRQCHTTPNWPTPLLLRHAVWSSVVLHWLSGRLNIVGWRCCLFPGWRQSLVWVRSPSPFPPPAHSMLAHAREIVLVAHAFGSRPSVCPSSPIAHQLHCSSVHRLSAHRPSGLARFVAHARCPIIGWAVCLPTARLTAMKQGSPG